MQEAPNKQVCTICKKPVTNKTKCVSCTIPPELKPSPPENQEPDLNYLYVLKALRQVGMYKYFSMGKKLTIDFLKGNTANKSIQRNYLYKMKYFGILANKEGEIEQMIDSLMLNGLILQRPIERNSFSKVLELTRRGQIEITEPTLYKKKLSFNFKEAQTQITPEDEENFQKFNSFLTKFNPEQKKAIISENNHVLCIAGAGSGKTTVLTKRIEFLVNQKQADPKKILAITFTRKARKEMIARLDRAGNFDSVSVETFNSFSEKLLRKHNDLFYGRNMRVLSFGNRIALIHRILMNMAIDMEGAVRIYFTPAQMRGKTIDQLSYIFINDCFFIRDHFKSKGKPITRDSFFSSNVLNNESTRLVFGICKGIEEYLDEYGLRDFADQLVDALTLLKKHNEVIPNFSHILVDEYQDVNSAQVELLELLNSPNLFCVGDPRQSIFGWRGSDISHILEFEEKYPNCEIITLTKNYRSTKQIVGLMNSSIRSMGLADIDSSIEGENCIYLQEFENEEREFAFVIESILRMRSNQTVFVLARTNKQLNELSEQLELRGIKHSVRSDERKKRPRIQNSNITLATIHAIKGMEADTVFVIGCSSKNFPCKASEHPVVDMIKSDEYDKEEEERRLFYVAMSRAKSKLYLTYSTSRPTHFINPSMLELVNSSKLTPVSISPKPMLKLETVSRQGSPALISKLKKWRTNICREHSVPAYIVLRNRTIEDLVQKHPTSIEGLSQIYGLGPAKISKYGESLLTILNTATTR